MDSAEGLSPPARERAAKAPKAPSFRFAVVPRPGGRGYETRLQVNQGGGGGGGLLLQYSVARVIRTLTLAPQLLRGSPAARERAASASKTPSFKSAVVPRAAGPGEGQFDTSLKMACSY